jgi:MFS family permease
MLHAVVARRASGPRSMAAGSRPVNDPAPIRPPAPAEPAAADPAAARRLLAASAVGSVVEWYDFFVFASAAALVFDRVFFPRADPRTGVLLSLMTFAVGFVTRPLGGVLFGALGDRYGRKRALVWSLVLMGAATVAVGLLPGYATLGALAPVVLVALRLVQGVAVGGEVGGAVLLVAESLPAARRGYWTAWPQTGGPAGNVLAAAVLAALAWALGDRAFGAWGWRVAFLLSGLLIGVGVWTRRRVEESPLFRRRRRRRRGRPGGARRGRRSSPPSPATGATCSWCSWSRPARTPCSTCSPPSSWSTRRGRWAWRGRSRSPPRSSRRWWRCR